MAGLQRILYPRLDAFPPAERDTVLRNAKATAFDVVELIGIGAGVVLATAATRYEFANFSALERWLAFLLNALVAFPLLAVLVGPFLVRRIRRGIELQVDRHERGT